MTTLSKVDPRLREKVVKLLEVMQKKGHPMVVVQGLRTVEEQQALFAQGRTKPGKIVTYADGVKVKSNHQSGRAADLTFLTPDFQVTWKGPWSLFGDEAERLGLRWGGRWVKPVDRPHVELL
jgi:peptidoglycan LD-endopeptidase CwlK